MSQARRWTLGTTVLENQAGAVMNDHGRFVTSELGRLTTATLHPSAVLRANDDDREDAMRMVVGDLRKVRKRLDGRNA